jgi:hypothetical protein
MGMLIMFLKTWLKTNIGDSACPQSEWDKMQN